MLRKRKQKAAFTLIELLVVISIISLLIGILLPALTGARKRAQMIVCQSNMRGTFYATSFYADANKDYIHKHYESATGKTWFTALIAAKYLSLNTAQTICPTLLPQSPFAYFYGTAINAHSFSNYIRRGDVAKPTQLYFFSSDVYFPDNLTSMFGGNPYYIYSSVTLPGNQWIARFYPQTHIKSGNMAYFEGHIAAVEQVHSGGGTSPQWRYYQ